MLWAKMQYGLCGKKLKVNDEALAKGDFKAMHLNNHQKKSLGLLLHVLFSHPKILYAPNTTDVNDLIDKVGLYTQDGLAVLWVSSRPKCIELMSSRFLDYATFVIS